jgi:hypothetical protein
VSTQGVSFRVPHDSQKVFRILNRKRFESPLVQVTRSLSFVMEMPSHGRHRGQSLEKLADLALSRGTNYKMPMIRHHGLFRPIQLINLSTHICSFWLHSRFDRMSLRIGASIIVSSKIENSSLAMTWEGRATALTDSPVLSVHKETQ